MTDDDIIREAWRALLRGDTDRRDELVNQVKRRIKARKTENIMLAEQAKIYFTKH